MTTNATNAMRRLGTVLLRCPLCKKRFSFARVPRFWIHRYEDGELTEQSYPGPEAQQDVACSYRCAALFMEKQNQTAPDNVSYTMYEDDYDHRDP